MLRINKYYSNKLVERIVIYLAVILFLLWTLLPFYWMFVTSVKPETAMYQKQFSIWPKNFTLENYTKLITKTNFLLYFKNSIVVTMITTFLSLIISVLAAFASAKLKFKGNKLIGQAIFFVYLLPAAVLVIPLYLILNQLHLIDSLLSLIVSFPVAMVPFCTWLLIGYFNSIPKELDEAAMIDGCSRIGTLFRITLPLSAPGLVATWVFSFVNAWNRYLFPLVFTSKESQRLLPIGLKMFITQDVFFWGQLMSAAILTALPTIILFAIVQKFVVQGLTAGAVKG